MLDSVGVYLPAEEIKCLWRNGVSLGTKFEPAPENFNS